MNDADPFEAFVRRYQDMVYATALRLLGRPADAEDAAQTVFLKAYEHFDQVGTSPTAAGWLKTVATNICLNHLSRYRNRLRLFSEMLTTRGDDGGEFEFDVPGLPTPDHLDDAERQAALDDALRSLPAHQRVPLVLFHFDEMSYQDIAERLRISLSKLKTDMHRGRLALKKHLSREDA